AAVAKILRLPADQPLVKGRISLILFRQRFDFTEWNKVMEKRDLPSEVTSQHKYNFIDAYALFDYSSKESADLDSLLAEQLAAIYASSVGDVPGWFATGTGQLVASRIHPRDPRFRQ